MQLVLLFFFIKSNDMKKIILLLMFFSLSANAQEIKIMSYNLRVDFGGDGENNWEFRREMLAGQIAYNAPDFIGTQEGKHHQLQYLLTRLPDYQYIGISRDDSKTEGEFSAIFYHSKRFRLLKQETFWLSETPEKKSKGWDAALERICTYGLFQEIATGKKFYAFNTHLDHIGIEARTNSAKLIVRKMAEINKEKLPVVFTGDFNSEPSTEAYKTIVQTMDDAKTVSKEKPFGPSGTFNGFKFNEPVKLLIDYIFVSKNVSVQKYAVLSDSQQCRYPSDHLPVVATVIF